VTGVRGLAHSNGTAYGLEVGRDHDWRVQGACNNYDPDLWTSATDSDRAQAIWVCQHECPVRRQCRDWANRNRYLVGQAVYGGVLWTRKHEERAHSRPARPCPQQPKPVPPTGLGAQRYRPEVAVRRAR
jgi:hypothetical protein